MYDLENLIDRLRALSIETIKYIPSEDWPAKRDWVEFVLVGETDEDVDKNGMDVIEQIRLWRQEVDVDVTFCIHGKVPAP